MDDSELLRRYLHERSQAAFSELVQRHLPLVYRAALRQADGNFSQAEDVSHAVFILLARKAPSLLRHPTLAGWLHTTVYFTASASQRAARRRRWHEQEASRMTDLPVSDELPPDWSRVQPVIDEALQRLDARDRDAILLRFFEELPFAEIAQRLNLREDAARMRLNRALARLREHLSSRGIRSTEAALTALFASEAVAAAACVPPALGAAIAHIAFTSAAPTSSTLLTLIAVKKSLIATALIAILVGILGTTFFLRRRLWTANAQVRSLQIENDSLRDRLTLAMLANPKGVHVSTPVSNRANANEPENRMNSIHSQVRLREASRDALPTAPAHPLKFRGYDTPINAVESWFWAGYHSDPDAIARSIYIDDAGRAVLDQIRATLPPSVQIQYPTAESLLAMAIAYDAIRHPGPNSEDILIDAPEPNYIDPDDFTAPGGRTWHKTADGWKYYFPTRPMAGFVNGVLHPNPSKP